MDMRAHNDNGITRGWRAPGAWWPWMRRLRDIDGKPSAWWFWTPVTYRFGHGGWVYLNLKWLWRFRRGV